MNVHTPLAITLLAALAWTVLFSLSSTPGIRGCRNLGILGAYVGLVVFLFRGGWKEVALTWAVFAVAGGIAYTSWEVLHRVRTSEDKEKPKVGFTHVFPSFVLWPIMIPEALEYALAELGVLKSKP